MNSWFSIDPCLNRKKNPVLFELSPEPSDLYVYVNPVPGTGADSYIDSESVIVLGTTSKDLDVPPTDLTKLYIGRSNWFELRV